jgi:hypothetical protein
MKVHLLQAQEDIGIERRQEGFLGFTVRERVWKGNEKSASFFIENAIRIACRFCCGPRSASLQFLTFYSESLIKGVVEFTRQVVEATFWTHICPE